MTTTALDPATHDHQHGHQHEHDDNHGRPAAWVGTQRIELADVDAEVTRLRSGPRAALLPLAGSAEGRQLRRWVTQTLVTRAVLEQEARRRGLGDGPPTAVVIPDRMAATTLGGVFVSVLRSSGPARAVYADVVRGVTVTAAEVRAYLDRSGSTTPPDPEIAIELTEAHARLTAARARQVYLDWLSARTAELVRLEPGHEHPGDPHQPDATHRH